MKHPDALRSECPDEHSFVFNELPAQTSNFSVLPLPLKWVWVSMFISTGGNGRKQVIMKLRKRRQSTMRTKKAKMNTRSKAFAPFNSHGIAIGQWIYVGAAHRDDWHQWRRQKNVLWSVSGFFRAIGFGFWSQCSEGTPTYESICRTMISSFQSYQHTGLLIFSYNIHCNIFLYPHRHINQPAIEK